MLTSLKVYLTKCSNYDAKRWHVYIYRRNWHVSTIIQRADMFNDTGETDTFQLWCKALTCLSIQTNLKCFNYNTTCWHVYVYLTKWHASTMMQSANIFKYIYRTCFNYNTRADMFKYTWKTDIFQLWCKALTCLSIQTRLKCFNYNTTCWHIYVYLTKWQLWWKALTFLSIYTDETDMFQL